MRQQRRGLPTEVNPNGNGTTTNGAGIAVAQHTTKLPIDVTLNGSIVKGYTAFYQSNPQKNSAEDIAKIKVSITGGTFTAINEGTNAVYSENLTYFVTGGTFSSDPGDYLAEGYVAAKDDTGDAWAVAPSRRATLSSGTTAQRRLCRTARRFGMLLRPPKTARPFMLPEASMS